MFPDKNWRTIDETNDKTKSKTLKKYWQHFFGRKEKIRIKNENQKRSKL